MTPAEILAAAARPVTRLWLTRDADQAIADRFFEERAAKRRQDAAALLFQRLPEARANGLRMRRDMKERGL